MENLFWDFFLGFWKVFFYVAKAFLPLLIGVILAYLLNNPVELVRKLITKNSSTTALSIRPKGRVPSIIITYLLLLTIIIVIIFAFVTLILGTFPSGGFSSITNNIYEYFNSYYETLLEYFSRFLPGEITNDNTNIKGFFMSWLQKNFSVKNIFSLFTVLAGGVVNLALGIVASIYIIKDKEFFLMLWQRFLSIVFKQKTHGILNEILYDINNVLTTFLKGAIIDSIIVALLSSVVLSLLKIKFSVIMGIIAGLVNVIPYFGPFLSMIPAFLISFAMQGPTKAILTILSLFLVQQLDSNFIYPKVVGTSTGLHPLFILLAVSFMGYFGGVLGMLVAVPVAGILQVLLKKWIYSL
ncbi:MAG: AI-2E family transporter [Firmicutes bacterium]|nr:AI-2E family transporter [Bacillota bacterium]